MAYPVNPTEFRQPPHSSVTQQDDARIATLGFNFNNFLPVSPVTSTTAVQGLGLTSGSLSIGIG